MLKYVLLATTMCIAAPAFAQETSPTDTPNEANETVIEAAPAADETAKVPTDTAAAPMPVQSEEALPAPAAPSQPVAEAAPAPTAAPATEVAAATPAPAPARATATTQDEIGKVVNAEFGNYDKNGDGTLDQTEFAAWIGALRKASEPSFAAESAEGKTWLAAAFNAADADKNAGVNATELTSFLTPKPAA